MRKKLLIFTEGGKGIGYGHLSRCSAIYDAAFGFDLEPTLILNEDAKSINTLSGNNAIFTNWQSVESLRKFDIFQSLCVVDSYIAGLDVYQHISNNCANVIYFDDENRIKYPKGYILNMSVDNGYDYTDSKLLGTDYALVRNVFLVNKKDKTNHEIKDILIFLGADFNNYTNQVVKKLKIVYPKTRLHLIKTTINQIFCEESENIKIYNTLNAEDFAKLIKECDVGIVTASQTSLEFCAVGTPFVCIRTVTNQSFDWMIKKGIIKKRIECLQGLDIVGIMQGVHDLESEGVRANLTKLMQGVIDGNAAKRIINKLVGKG